MSTSRRNNLTGRVFGRLTVLFCSPERANDGHVVWACQCSCGRMTLVQSNNLKAGTTKSCGCLAIENLQKAHSPTFIERFWSRVRTGLPNECWPWEGYVFVKRGRYGGISEKSRYFRSHRIAWMLAYGCIPDGLHVLHKCDNPPCCNPLHLFLGTQKENMADMINKNRGWWLKEAS